CGRNQPDRPGGKPGGFSALFMSVVCLSCDARSRKRDSKLLLVWLHGRDGSFAEAHVPTHCSLLRTKRPNARKAQIIASSTCVPSKTRGRVCGRGAAALVGNDCVLRADRHPGNGLLYVFGLSPPRHYQPSFRWREQAE